MPDEVLRGSWPRVRRAAAARRCALVGAAAEPERAVAVPPGCLGGGGCGGVRGGGLRRLGLGLVGGTVVLADAWVRGARLHETEVSVPGGSALCAGRESDRRSPLGVLTAFVVEWALGTAVRRRGFVRAGLAERRGARRHPRIAAPGGVRRRVGRAAGAQRAGGARGSVGVGELSRRLGNVGGGGGLLRRVTFPAGRLRGWLWAL